MARKPRLHYPGAFYHVMLRGNGGQEIFFSEDDRYYFYFLLGEGRERYNHRIHAFCQMRKHIHLVIQVGETPLSQIIGNDHFSNEVLALADEQRRHRWSYDQLIASLCLIYGIDNKTLLESGKRQPAAEARAVAALLVQENNHTALTDLGKIFSRDLSALSKAAGRIRERLRNDAELQGKIKTIKINLEQMSKCQA